MNTNLPIMKRNIYQPAIGCSYGLHTWPTLLQSVCKSDIIGTYQVPEAREQYFREYKRGWVVGREWL